MGREERYVQKIRNDVEEKLYELLILHLRDIDAKIRIHAEDNEELKSEFVSILDSAIRELCNSVTKFNKLPYYRYIILLSNTVLRFDKGRQDLKDLKKELVEDYTHSERDEHGYIPLNYQMNEVRITYDVGYLSFLVQKYIDRGDWVRALYCLKAVEMLEPDDERIDDWNKVIFQNLKGREPKENRPETPIGKRLAIDSNIAISMITADIGGYRFKEHEYFDDGFLSTNDIMITPSVRSEVQSHIEYLNVKIGQFCRKDDRSDQDYIITELERRYEAILDRYYHDVELEEKDEVMKKIRNFYLQFAPTLIAILEDKMGHYVVSHKLRKLAQREDLLPEMGDMALLSEVISLKENGEKIDGILSMDKDFTIFSRDIFERFGVAIYIS